MKKHSDITIPSATSISHNRAWIGLGVILLLVTIVRARLLDVPLERDEGEYAYMGQLILQGIPPYAIAYNVKFPGTYFMYAFFMSMFGQSITGVHLGLLIVNLISIILLFLLTRKLINTYAGLVAASAFALLSLGLSIFGFAGHATHFILPWALGGTLLLFKATTESKKIYYALSGILLGVAPLMKQPGASFCLFGGFFLILTLLFHRTSGIRANIVKFILFLLGGVAPCALMIIFLEVSGVFKKFWSWTIEYAWIYENQVQWKTAYSIFRHSFSSVLDGVYLIWIVAGAGLIALFMHPRFKKDFRVLFILSFFIFSFFSVCPGFYFRPHYFVTLLPAIALLFSVLTDYVLELSKLREGLKPLQYIGYGLFIIPITIGLITQSSYLFQLSPNEISRTAYGTNPFPESIEIAKYISANSDKKDKIAILGSEPQICFYTNRHSASGYIYTYNLMETHENSLAMQQEMTQEIGSAMPRYFIYFHIQTSWLARPTSQAYIFTWIDLFLRHNQYQLKGIIDIYPKATIYKWNNEVEQYRHQSDNYVLVFERKQ